MVNRGLNHDYLNIAMESKDNLVRAALSLMGLTVHEPETGESLVIGDSPVLIVRGTVNGERSLLNPGSQVLLPIGSKRLLVYSWETPSNLIQPGPAIGRENVRSLGTDYYRETGSRYIFARNRTSLKQARTSKNRWGASRRAARTNDGWRLMQSLKQLASMHHAERDKEFELTLDVAIA